MSDQFIVHRLRSKPIKYTVTINHFVSAGEWQMGVTVQDVGEDDTNRERVAADLRAAADMLESNLYAI